MQRPRSPARVPAGTLRTVILAEFETYLSRPIAPTRRIALGRLDLPCDPAPGFGGVLLGGVLARFASDLDEDTTVDVLGLLTDVDLGRRIPQPRARHRFQVDRVGLRPCSHRLIRRGHDLVFEFDGPRGTPSQHVLGAVYAATTVAPGVRPVVVASLRKGFRWRGEIGPALVAHLAGRGAESALRTAADPVAWAMQVLRLSETGERDPGAVVDLTVGCPALPSRSLVQQAFRAQIRAAHPDHGAGNDGAAERISELSEARRILLG